MKASLLIPVYNSAAYIPKCIESITKQTFKDYEVVFINDGSTDSSKDVIEKLSKNARFKFKLISQENKGIAEARNTALENASGEYIFFIDNDDYICENYLEHYITIAQKIDADMVVGGFKRVNEANKLLYTFKLKNFSWSPFRIQTPWARCYKRNFIEKHSLRFLNVRLGEDASFNIPANIAAKKIVITDYNGYNWVDVKKSFSNTIQKEPQHSGDVIKLLHHIKKESYKFSPDNIQKEMIEYFCIKYSLWFLLYTLKGSKEDTVRKVYTDILSNLDQLFPEWQKNPLISPVTPRGETFKIKNIVWFFTIIKRFSLEKNFFELYRKLSLGGKK